MPLFISHNSALEFWQLTRQSSAVSSFVPSKRRMAAPDEIATRDQIKALSDGRLPAGISNRPIHLTVCNTRSRNNPQGCIIHQISSIFPQGAFVTISPDVFVATPEECFVQMALVLDLHSLIKLGFELCGTYTEIPETGPDEVDTRFSNSSGPHPAPCTTPERLSEYLSRNTARHGLTAARRAQATILAQSASPMETRLAMLLTLPPRLGGYGLPAPQLNARVNLTQESQRIGKRQWCVGDMVWPTQKLIVEYDSNGYHTGAERIAADAQRRDALLAEGYQVVTVTWAQVANVERFDALAKMLAKCLGWRLRIRSQTFPALRHELRQKLFS